MTALILAGLVACLVAGAVFRPSAVMRRRLRNAARVRIKDLQEGVPARIVGKARALAPDKALAAPLTNRPCVIYIATVDQRVHDHSSGKDMWQHLARHEERTPFLVDDASGKVVVEVDGAVIDVEFDRDEMIRPQQCPPHIEKFVDHHRMPGAFRVSWDDGKVRYREAIIGIEEFVAVLGIGIEEPDPDGVPDDAYRGTQKMRMRMASSKQVQVLISDAPETKD